MFYIFSILKMNVFIRYAISRSKDISRNVRKNINQCLLEIMAFINFTKGEIFRISKVNTIICENTLTLHFV